MRTKRLYIPGRVGLVGIAIMSLLLEPSFTTKKGYFSLKELRILAVELGYDRHLFERKIKIVPSGRLVSESEVCSWLDVKAFDRELDCVYNEHDATYNVKVIKRAMHHIRRRTLSFKDLSKCRQIYEMQTADCPHGISSRDVDKVLDLLKLLDKILSPSKLRHIIKAKSHQLDNARLLQLYDMFDILSLADDMWRAEEEFEKRKKQLPCRRRCTYMQYHILEKDELELPYQQLLNNMEAQYKSSLLKNKPRPSRVAAIPLHRRDITASYIDSKRRERSVTASHQQGRVLSDCLQRSTSQLLVARTGHAHLLSPIDYSSRMCQSAPPLTIPPTRIKIKLLHRSSTSIH